VPGTLPAPSAYQADDAGGFRNILPFAHARPPLQPRRAPRAEQVNEIQRRLPR